MAQLKAKSVRTHVGIANLGSETSIHVETKHKGAVIEWYEWGVVILFKGKTVRVYASNIIEVDMLPEADEPKAKAK